MNDAGKNKEADGAKTPGRAPMGLQVLTGGRADLERRWLALFINAWADKSPKAQERLHNTERMLMSAAHDHLTVVPAAPHPPTDGSDEG